MELALSNTEIMYVLLTCTVTLLLISPVIFIYFFPSVVAYRGNHSLKRVIFWFNAMSIPITTWLADGFTFWFLLPWTITLFWSASE